MVSRDLFEGIKCIIGWDVSNWVKCGVLERDVRMKWYSRLQGRKRNGVLESLISIDCGIGDIGGTRRLVMMLCRLARFTREVSNCNRILVKGGVFE